MDDQELLRYSRQIMLPEIDLAGQRRLLDAKILIIGLGGLGSPAAMYLAAAGIGTLTLVDHDQVDIGNLQRQIAHRTRDIGRQKVDSAAETLAAINPLCRIVSIPRQLDPDGLSEAVAAADVVLDCSDNFATRFAVNAACVDAQTPLVSGAAIRWEGQVSVFAGRRGAPCYRCLYATGDEPEESCSANGVVAPLVGIIGSCQALESIKLLTGVGESLAGFVLYFDGKRMEWRRLKLPKDPNCPVCQPSPPRKLTP